MSQLINSDFCKKLQKSCIFIFTFFIKFLSATILAATILSKPIIYMQPLATKIIFIVYTLSSGIEPIFIVYIKLSGIKSIFIAYTQSSDIELILIAHVISITLIKTRPILIIRTIINATILVDLSLIITITNIGHTLTPF